VRACVRACERAYLSVFAMKFNYNEVTKLSLHSAECANKNSGLVITCGNLKNAPLPVLFAKRSAYKTNHMFTLTYTNVVY